MKTIAYEEKFGEIKFPAGFEEKLRGKSLEEQMDCYRITNSITLSSTSYGELDKQQIRERTRSLEEGKDCTGLVVKDGLLVGVLIRPFWGGRPGVSALQGGLHLLCQRQRRLRHLGTGGLLLPDLCVKPGRRCTGAIKAMVPSCSTL